MFDRLKTALDIAGGENNEPKQESAPDSPAAPLRTLADIRAELAMARESQAALTSKLDVAQVQLTTAQAEYDAGIQAYALGEGPDPGRGDLQACLTKFEALQRVSRATVQRIAALAAEVAAAEPADAIVAGRERIPALVEVGEARLAEFTLAIVAARRAEDALFAALFSERDGLKQKQPSEELDRVARKHRFDLRNRAIAAAKSAGYVIGDSFETDGLPNLGREFTSMHFQRQRLLGSHDAAREAWASGSRAATRGGE